MPEIEQDGEMNLIGRPCIVNGQRAADASIDNSTLASDRFHNASLHRFGSF
jgi:hypothetical protein